MLAQDSCITSTTRIIQKPKSRMLKKAKEKKSPIACMAMKSIDKLIYSLNICATQKKCFNLFRNRCKNK